MGTGMGARGLGAHVSVTAFPACLLGLYPRPVPSLSLCSASSEDAEHPDEHFLSVQLLMGAAAHQCHWAPGPGPASSARAHLGAIGSFPFCVGQGPMLTSQGTLPDPLFPAYSRVSL